VGVRTGSLRQAAENLAAPLHIHRDLSERTMVFESGNTGVMLTVALAAVLAYVVYTVTYNVYLHPLAKFPGPIAARATTYWKAYVECIQQRSFCHLLVDLHARYGEIVYRSLH
jgi:hypothetical protein